MEKPELYWSVNRDGTRGCLAAVSQAGALGLVLSAACALFGQPERARIDDDQPQRPSNVDGQTKAAMEGDIRAAGLPHVILRYFNAAGASADGVLGERHH